MSGRWIFRLGVIAGGLCGQLRGPGCGPSLDQSHFAGQR